MLSPTSPITSTPEFISVWTRNGLRSPRASTSRAFESGDVAYGLSGGVSAPIEAFATPTGNALVRSRNSTPRRPVLSCAPHGNASSPRLAINVPSAPKRSVPPLWFGALSGIVVIRFMRAPLSSSRSPPPVPSRSPVSVTRTIAERPPAALWNRYR